MTNFQITHCGTSTQLSELLSNEQFQFIEYLHNKYDENRIELLKNRENRQRNYDNGASPEYDKNSEACTSKWKVAPIPNDLKVRRVEITKAN